MQRVPENNQGNHDALSSPGVDDAVNPTSTPMDDTINAYPPPSDPRLRPHPPRLGCCRATFHLSTSSSIAPWPLKISSYQIRI